ncbi:hypothetical protein JL49_17310 [Pseudoalteromonas luteoviolacea]|nr:hypothetical protein JL49_17310 [Pseudoalteromonas luteoviolacea]
MSNVSILSIDLAKNAFQLLGIDQSGKPFLSKRLSRTKLYEALINLPTCEVVMEACSSSHYWGRVCLAAGHQGLKGKHLNGMPNCLVPARMNWFN